MVTRPINRVSQDPGGGSWRFPLWKKQKAVNVLINLLCYILFKWEFMWILHLLGKIRILALILLVRFILTPNCSVVMMQKCLMEEKSHLLGFYSS